MARLRAALDSVVIYRRVSTREQATEGVSLEAQESACRKIAELRGLPVAAVFTDAGVSGKDGIAERPGLASVLQHVANFPGTIVVVYSVSRLARRQRLLWSLLDPEQGKGLAIVSATEPFDTTTPMGRAMLGMIAVWAQLEADMVSERTRDALAALKAKGVKIGRRPMSEENPAAHKAVLDLRKKHPDKPIVWLAEELNRRGIDSSRGGQWSPKTVRSALRQGVVL